uniref:Ovule protein n=1 Tax=Steinernema glaseri TaxID=37863 RepID=A0A1I7Z197_9BILA
MMCKWSADPFRNRSVTQGNTFLHDLLEDAISVFPVRKKNRRENQFCPNYLKRNLQFSALFLPVKKRMHLDCSAQSYR